MHLLRTETRLLDEAESPVDLALPAADILFFSLTDNDLALIARASSAFSVTGVPLAALKHPYSLDKTIETLGPAAKLVVMRLLGGREAAPYAVDEWRSYCRARGVPFLLLSGEPYEEAPLTALSSLCPALCARAQAFLIAGGPDNLVRLLAFLTDLTGPDHPCRKGDCTNGCAHLPPAPEPLPASGLWEQATRTGAGQRASVIFYRTAMLAGDTAPILALADALHAEGLSVEAIFVPSLKDAAAGAFLRHHLRASRPDVILTTTAFAARQGETPSPLEEADCPILQAVLAGSSREGWEANPRGLAPADLAMNVILPEVDGRLITRPISFKAEETIAPGLPPVVMHRPDPERVTFVARLAAHWARLREGHLNEKRIGLIVPDYPGRGGRQGFAVGLDTAASLGAIARLLGHTPDWPDDTALMQELSAGPSTVPLTADDYAKAFAAYPAALRASMEAAWGPPPKEDFAFRIRRLGPLMIALQPDRGHTETRRADYHDTSLPPCHAYAAFYALMRRDNAALVHLGTHGTLEWLPGKAVALSNACAPEALLGPTPLIAPFIVNNPGEAAQARRRTAALTLGHLTPPLTRAGAEGPLAALEPLFDEYASAEHMDRKRAEALRTRILEEATRQGLIAEIGEGADEGETLARLDAFLCDIKDMRVGDGLHVYGQETHLPADMDAEEAQRRALSPQAEREGLIAALTGRFVAPGPSGAPSPRRLDVLPTGRNLYASDPRALPSPIAYDFGRRNAKSFIARYTADHGDYPRALVMDLWGSSSLRTGGEDFAQALALLGVRPEWDAGTGRVTGITVLPLAALDHPRVDVTLRVSGLARDLFAPQIALFALAVKAVAARDEDRADNPLVGETQLARVFGAAPGAYGLSLGGLIDADTFSTRDELGASYASDSAYAQDGGAGAFEDRLQAAQALLHMQDLAGQDVLSGSAYATHEGGFAASAPQAQIYHMDATDPEAVKVRTLAEEVARAVRGRLANPRWINGQMRHSHRGAAEIADGLDNLYAFAALSDAAKSHHFDLVFDATLGDERVRAFLAEANPQAFDAMRETFRRALRRGYWQGRRNSVGAVLG